MGFSEAVVSSLASGWLKLVWRTAIDAVRVNADEIDRLAENRSPYVYAFWHNRILMGPFATKTPHRDVVPVVSASKDGEYITRTVAKLGHIHAVRGSSSRGGKEALREAVNQLRRGRVMAVTPDGPLGPVYKAKDGAVVMARLANVPIVPFAYNCSRKKTVNSWDKFIVPMPCARHVFIFGNTIRVEKNDNVREKCLELENELNRITAQADNWEF
ncbi:MAG: lysophospholipid acyltransferase family protein [Acidobacteria bacterium]|nr:lysophospholipid acyltransferase family protein [Acidobacteriota bacterium]